MISALLPSFLEAAKRRGNLHSVVAVLIKKVMLEAKGGKVYPVHSPILLNLMSLNYY